MNDYSESSGFVHLSKKHVFASSIVKDRDDGVVEFKVSKEGKFVPLGSRIEAIEGMLEIANCIKKLLEGWIWTKNNPEELEKIRKGRCE